jgi:hypothetical protein
MQIEVADDGFIAMLVAHSVLDELDRELVKCNSAIFELGGKATITVKAQLGRVPKLDTAVDTYIDIKSKHPEHERPSRTLFVTPSNGVTDQFQEQKPLGLGQPVAAQSVLGKPLSKVSTLNAGK